MGSCPGCDNRLVPSSRPLFRRGRRQPRQVAADWFLWGPYLSMRQWGTVREDYSADGDAWSYFPYEQASRRAYRWGEDGLLGVCDRRQRVCLSFALWNGQDACLKERAFGLSNAQGNHGEDVKEYWHYLDALPDGRYLRAVYRYPMAAFPYEELLRRNSQPGPELNLLDLGYFEDDRYWSVQVEYGKAKPSILGWRFRVTNHSREAGELHLLPQVWLRNTWAWNEGGTPPAILRARADRVSLSHPELGDYCLQAAGAFEWLMCDNETDAPALFGQPPRTDYPKDAIARAVLAGNPGLCRPEATGTRAAAHFRLKIPPGGSRLVRLVWTADAAVGPDQVDAMLSRGRARARRFYSNACAANASAEDRMIQRQAWSGLLWSQQYYEYDVERWLSGDPASPPPPERQRGRNSEWGRLRAADVIVMPDSWEYPWFAAWDLAFHALALEAIDSQMAKQQLMLLLETRYIHEDGQLPAYEWDFSDCNPPVHAMAVWHVYVRDRNRTGVPDRAFLERAFLALLFDYGWWVNRRDLGDQNIFSGGFLGLDNISAVDRSHLPPGAQLAQADATAWMGMFAVKMFRIAAELAMEEPQYSDMALHFFEHYVHIAEALNGAGRLSGLWNEVDGFYYDRLRLPDGRTEQIKVRSLVGLMPMVASEVVHQHTLDRVPSIERQLEVAARSGAFHYRRARSEDPYACLTLVAPDRLRRLLASMLDPAEFLSQHGLRSLSRFHLDQPYRSRLLPDMPPVRYEPGTSEERIMGGNSNWRGPIWFPTSYLLIQALRLLAVGLGRSFTQPFPSPEGRPALLTTIADRVADSMVAIFRNDQRGRRPVFGESEKFQTDPGWHDCLLFREYFDGEDGRGHGAAHQTGWTALVALLVGELSDPWRSPVPGSSPS